MIYPDATILMLENATVDTSTSQLSQCQLAMRVDGSRVVISKALQKYSQSLARLHGKGLSAH